jgi:hypothetical protein
VYNPNASSGQQHHQLKKLAEDILNQGATPKNVAKLLGEILDRSSKDIYAQIVKPER